MALLRRVSTFLFALLCFSEIGQISSSGSTDSATIRAIEREVRRVKGTSENIFVEIKKQKDITTALQNEFKWFHNEVKGLKKSLADIEMLVNQTVRNDTEYIRGKITDLTNFIFNVGKVRALPKPTNMNNTLNVTTSTTSAPTSSTTTTTKKFKLF